MGEQVIEFYFDFSSPYGYLAAEQIDDLAAGHGRSVAWKPFLLGAVFKQTGSQPLLDIPLKGEYGKHDMLRSARLQGVPFVFPPLFPFASVAAARAFYALTDADPAAAKRLALALYRAAFAEGRDISKPEAVLAVAGEQGLEPGEVRAAIDDPAVKARLREEVEAAAARGVFGSPFIIVDGEPFWGHDRLPQVDLWLARGGW